MDTHQTSPRTLAKASAGAAIAAGLVLTLIVLPAEAGIDPTGFGGAIGLTGMAAATATPTEAAPAPVAAAAPAATAATGTPDRQAIEKPKAWRSDEMTIVLAPHSGAEVKAHMDAGDHFVFRWESKGGPVKVDMHGERSNAAEGEFTSYWEERQRTDAQGALTAPFAGTHGWYWRNKGETPVTVTVRTTGFYKDLFKPAAG